MQIENEVKEVEEPKGVTSKSKPPQQEKEVMIKWEGVVGTQKVMREIVLKNINGFTLVAILILLLSSVGVLFYYLNFT